MAHIQALSTGLQVIQMAQEIVYPCGGMDNGETEAVLLMSRLFVKQTLSTSIVRCSNRFLPTYYPFSSSALTEKMRFESANCIPPPDKKSYAHIIRHFWTIAMIRPTLFSISILTMNACSDGLTIQPKTIEDPTIDHDGDGFSLNDGDCNDSDPLISPNGIEICDTIDNNCDGRIDEDLTIERYRDEDEDGYGDSNAAIQACENDNDFVDNPDDCNDDDPDSTTRLTDADCDGAITATDCNDDDPDSTIVESDSDCDGITTDLDCDDSNPDLLSQDNDADCDGIITEDDCNDQDPTVISNENDTDCDGAITLEDCDDNDPTLGSIAQDQDCDGIVTDDDCNDNDPNPSQVSQDADCDGTHTADDCDDFDAMSTTVAIDADCDGVVTANDCDDMNLINNHRNGCGL